MKCPECGVEAEVIHGSIMGCDRYYCKNCGAERIDVEIEEVKARAAALTEHSKYNDPVTKPSHYNWHPSGVECKTIAEAFCYNLGCAIEYIWWAGRKGDVIEDLKKAQEHIKNEIERLERKP